MKFRLTILNASAIIYIICCFVYCLINYSVLSGGEGWGLAFMLVLIVLGFSALLVNYIIVKLFKNRKTQLIVSGLATILYAILIYWGL